MKLAIDMKKVFSTEHILNVAVGVLILGTVLFWFGSLFLDGSYQTYKSRPYAADTFDSQEFVFDPAFEEAPFIPGAEYEKAAAPQTPAAAADTQTTQDTQAE